MQIRQFDLVKSPPLYLYNKLLVQNNYNKLVGGCSEGK